MEGIGHDVTNKARGHDRTGTLDSDGSGGHSLGVLRMEETTTVETPRKELSPKSANKEIDRSSP